MPAQFRNLVFEGGGVKGIAYVGAMQILEQRGILKDVVRVGGASAGTINALIFALGFDVREQHDILRSAEFSKSETFFKWFEDPESSPVNRIG
jgi:NTE family protein